MTTSVHTQAIRAAAALVCGLAIWPGAVQAAPNAEPAWERALRIRGEAMNQRADADRAATVGDRCHWAVP
jgi:hypothetical protein